MRTTSALKTAALLIVAVVLALGTVQGSLAVWNTATSSNAGKVQAADFAVTLKSGSTEPQRLPVNGVPATISTAELSELKPGKTSEIKVEVTNATDSGSGEFRVGLSASALEVSGKAAQYLSREAGFSTSVDCKTKLMPSVELAQGAKTTLCVRLTLDSKAPATVGGQKNPVSLELTATQL